MKSQSILVLINILFVLATLLLVQNTVLTAILGTILACAGIIYTFLLKDRMTYQANTIQKFEDNFITANKVIASLKESVINHQKMNETRKAVINMQDDLLKDNQTLINNLKESKALYVAKVEELIEKNSALQLQLTFELDAEHIIAQHYM